MAALQPSQDVLVAEPDAFEQLIERLNNIQDPGEWMTADPNAVQAAKDEKPARIDLGSDAEQKVKDYLNRLLHGDLRKSRLIERVMGRGTPHQFSVWASTDVDLVGSVQLEYNSNVAPVPAHIEVKSIISKNWSLDGLRDKEHDYLSDALGKRHVAWLALAWYNRYNACASCGYTWIQHPARKCPQCYSAAFNHRFGLDTLHLVRYREWNDFLSKLKARSKTDSRFRGKSIRRQTDWDLLAHCQIDKVGGRWQIPPRHWLAPYLPTTRPSASQDTLPI